MKTLKNIEKLQKRNYGDGWFLRTPKCGRVRSDRIKFCLLDDLVSFKVYLDCFNYHIVDLIYGSLNEFTKYCRIMKAALILQKNRFEFNVDDI